MFGVGNGGARAVCSVCLGLVVLYVYVYMCMCVCVCVSIYMDISYLSLLLALGVVGALFWCFCC